MKLPIEKIPALTIAYVQFNKSQLNDAKKERCFNEFNSVYLHKSIPDNVKERHTFSVLS